MGVTASWHWLGIFSLSSEGRSARSPSFESHGTIGHVLLNFYTQCANAASKRCGTGTWVVNQNLFFFLILDPTFLKQKQDSTILQATNQGL